MSSWVGMLNIVRHHLKKYHIRSQTISGEVKIADRQLIVQAFNSNENRFMVRSNKIACFFYKRIYLIFSSRFFFYH